MSAPTTASTTSPAPRVPPSRWATAAWVGHGLLRFVLFGITMIYAWSKMLLFQMHSPDYSDLLVTLGEKSPMGLLWTFMGYSPLVQFLAGLAEFVAASLLIWRRTAWLGGLLGAASMGVVFVLNMTFDVPVKQLSLALTVGFLIVLAPEVPRLARVVAGLPAPPIRTPRPIPWPRVHAVTRWVFGVGGVLVALSPLALDPLPPSEPTASTLPGAYRVVDDTAAPAGRLAEDRRWQEVAFGRDARRGDAGVAVRYANGDLQRGVYRTVDDRTVELTLDPVLGGDGRGFVDPPPARRSTLTVAPAGGDRLRLTGDGQDLTLAPDRELRFLLDRGFSWTVSVMNR